MEARIAKSLLLTKVLAADGIITENERAYLDRTMTLLGLSPDEQKRVLALEGWDEAEAALLSLTEDQKREVISSLVDAAAADGRLSPLEASMVKNITKALGIVV
jgi:uncharacterized tellurite resistance protein B-like protein